MKLSVFTIFIGIVVLVCLQSAVEAGKITWSIFCVKNTIGCFLRTIVFMMFILLQCPAVINPVVMLSACKPVFVQDIVLLLTDVCAQAFSSRDSVMYLLVVWDYTVLQTNTALNLNETETEAINEYNFKTNAQKFLLIFIIIPL